jgi:hypothetical protein
MIRDQDGVCVRLKAFLVATVTLALFDTLPAQAERSCSPNTNAARILAQPSPNAIHPAWRGDAFVGVSWSFLPRRTVSNMTGQYAFGDLLSPRGGVVNRDVYILLSEWQCEDL